MKGRTEPGIEADLTMPAARPMRARRAQRRLSADGLCTASPPPFSLRTRYCGSSSEALTVRPAASVSEVILRSTTPGVSFEPCELHTTLSPFLNSSAMTVPYPVPRASSRGWARRCRHALRLRQPTELSRVRAPRVVRGEAPAAGGGPADDRVASWDQEGAGVAASSRLWSASRSEPMAVA